MTRRRRRAISPMVCYLYFSSCYTLVPLSDPSIPLHVSWCNITKKMFWEKSVVKGITCPTSPPVPGFFNTLRQRAQLADKARDIPKSCIPPQAVFPFHTAIKGYTRFRMVSCLLIILCITIDSIHNAASDLSLINRCKLTLVLQLMIILSLQGRSYSPYGINSLNLYSHFQCCIPIRLHNIFSPGFCSIYNFLKFSQCYKLLFLSPCRDPALMPRMPVYTPNARSISPGWYTVDEVVEVFPC